MPTQSLWRNPPFLRLWFAQAMSNAGSQITGIALPLTAVLVLGATPTQMGLLNIAGRSPDILLGLLAGVWVDRRRRQPVLVGADLGRALLLGSIPAAALLGCLTLTQLYVVAFLAGTLTLFFTLASISVLPSLVTRDQLVEANSKLAFSDSVVTVAGPSAAGALVQLLDAPRAIVADAVSFLLSAFMLGGLGASEAAVRQAPRLGVWAEIGEGVRELVRTPLLRALTTAAGAGTLGTGVQATVLMLFLTRELGFGPAIIGLAFACGGGGALLGASLAGSVANRLGTGRAIVLGGFLWGTGALIIPLAGFAVGDTRLLLVFAGQAVEGLGGTFWGINQMSLRQAITPVGLFGRVTAARRFIIFSTQIAGAALGGVLGSMVGLRTSLLIGAVGLGMSFLLTLLSPVRHVRTLSAIDPRL